MSSPSALPQVFVETLDRYFENVCELDIIFNTEKVHAVLDEIVMGGMVVETNIQEITAAIDGQARAEKAELGAVPHMFAPNRAMTTTARQR